MDLLRNGRNPALRSGSFAEVRSETARYFAARRRKTCLTKHNTMADDHARTIHYEDLAAGRVYRSASVVVSAEEIVSFATRYDPQPFHLDASAAERSVFGGLVASGWLTASLTMRLMVTGEFQLGGGAIGLGVDSLRWPEPVRPGDTLTASVEIVSMRASESKPNFGIVKIRTTTTNQRGEVVQVMVSNILIRRRARS
jgi:acyl dehydratase